MASRGARNLALLSRSGAKGDDAKALVIELELKGVCVATPQVNIGDLNNLTQVFNDLAKIMPPVKGCIQAAVALRVYLFHPLLHFKMMS